MPFGLKVHPPICKNKCKNARFVGTSQYLFLVFSSNPNKWCIKNGAESEVV
jgi:hypothetical protein